MQRTGADTGIGEHKYTNVRLVTAETCSACGGSGEPQTDDAPEGAICGRCFGSGETHGELLNEGEPFFLVRGQDALALVAVYAYMGAALARDQITHARGVQAKGLQIKMWQEGNPGLVKDPD